MTKHQKLIELHVDYFKEQGLDKYHNYKSFILKNGPKIRKTSTSGYYPDNMEKHFIFDPIPLIISNEQWQVIKAGVDQRARMFTKLLENIESLSIYEEIYNAITTSPYYYKDGLNNKLKQWLIYGPDIVWNKEGEILVLEDNQGVVGAFDYPPELYNAYRQIYKGKISTNIFLEYEDRYQVLSDYLSSISHMENTFVLTGPPSSPYIREQVQLASKLGIAPVQIRDLFLCEEGYLNTRTIQGDKRVEILIKRIKSNTTNLKILSIPNKTGKVTVLEGYGSNVVNDKVIFKYVPELIELLLGEKPILKQPKTHWLNIDNEFDLVMSNASKYVYKKRNGLGGSHVIVGPLMQSDELNSKLQLIYHERAMWVAQEYVEIDVTPSLHVSDKIESINCPYDFRPFSIIGEEVTVLTGGISRVNQGTSGVLNVSSGGKIKNVMIIKDGEYDCI